MTPRSSGCLTDFTNGYFINESRKSGVYQLHLPVIICSIAPENLEGVQ